MESSQEPALLVLNPASTGRLRTHRADVTPDNSAAHTRVYRAGAVRSTALDPELKMPRVTATKVHGEVLEVTGTPRPAAPLAGQE